MQNETLSSGIFQPSFLWWVYVIRHNSLHMCGYTISEMIPSPPDDVRGAHGEPPESEGGSLLLNQERCQLAGLSVQLPAQSRRVSSVLVLSVPTVSSPHSFPSSCSSHPLTHRAKLCLERPIFQLKKIQAMYTCLCAPPTQNNLIHLESISEKRSLHHTVLDFSKQAPGKSATNIRRIISISTRREKSFYSGNSF